MSTTSDPHIARTSDPHIAPDGDWKRRLSSAAATFAAIAAAAALEAATANIATDNRTLWGATVSLKPLIGGTELEKGHPIFTERRGTQFLPHQRR